MHLHNSLLLICFYKCLKSPFNPKTTPERKQRLAWSTNAWKWNFFEVCLEGRESGIFTFILKRFCLHQSAHRFTWASAKILAKNSGRSEWFIWVLIYRSDLQQNKRSHEKITILQGGVRVMFNLASISFLSFCFLCLI